MFHIFLHVNVIVDFNVVLVGREASTRPGVFCMRVLANAVEKRDMHVLNRNHSGMQGQRLELTVICLAWRYLRVSL